jgi:hypothetical protein
MVQLTLNISTRPNLLQNVIYISAPYNGNDFGEAKLFGYALDNILSGGIPSDEESPFVAVVDFWDAQKGHGQGEIWMKRNEAKSWGMKVRGHWER